MRVLLPLKANGQEPNENKEVSIATTATTSEEISIEEPPKLPAAPPPTRVASPVFASSPTLLLSAFSSTNLTSLKSPLDSKRPAKRARPDSKPMAIKRDQPSDDPDDSFDADWVQPVENEPPVPQDLESFRQSLANQGLEMIPQEGDGNCLFRAVALQVYGQAENHAEVRERVMDFMENNPEHYANFVTDVDFKTYVMAKRQLGVHGNHAEIQAVSELYNRPVQVYTVNGPMNIFHAEYKTTEIPIRLSYHNQNHYNAIVDPLLPTAGVGLGLPGLKPGLADQLQLTKAKTESDALHDQMELERVLAESKKELKNTEEDELQRVLKESSRDFFYGKAATHEYQADFDTVEQTKVLANNSIENCNQSSKRRRNSPRSSPTVHDVPRYASIPSAASVPPAAARLPTEPDGDYPEIVVELSMNGFPLEHCMRAYSLVGNNFDDMLCFLLSNSSNNNNDTKTNSS